VQTLTRYLLDMPGLPTSNVLVLLCGLMLPACATSDH
jgi:hypothetical protein